MDGFAALPKGPRMLSSVNWRENEGGRRWVQGDPKLTYKSKMLSGAYFSTIYLAPGIALSKGCKKNWFGIFALTPHRYRIPCPV